MTERRYEILGRERCHDGHFKLDRYRVRHTLFRGGWGETRTLELFERGHAAAVLPYDPAADAVVLVEQFRLGAMATEAVPWLLEAVAGVVEAGESVAEVVRREAMEEAGLELGPMVHVTDFLATPGACSERIAVWCARVDSADAGGVHGLDDEGEDIAVRVVPAEEAIAMATDGRVLASHTVIALLWLAGHRTRLREEWGD